MDDLCVFCAIISGEAPATVVRRWPDAIAIVPLGPVVDGHTLVIPTRHVRDALEDPDVTAAAVRRAAEIATHPCNLIANVGREASQSVWHLHWHIVPRTGDDGLHLPWDTGRRKRETETPPTAGTSIGHLHMLPREPEVRIVPVPYDPRTGRMLR